jgi:two-component system sensor histidine kinase CpxA
MVVGILEQRADEGTRPYIQDLRDEVQQMSSLVSELLSFSKASLAGPALKLKAVNLRELIARAVEREKKEGTNIVVEMPDEAQALGDPDLLHRAFANLIRNAVRYAGDNGPITISCSREAGVVAVKISDCGPGVSEQFLQRLFDPFFRVDDARTRESGGVGLGMTIVKTCVEACKGTVSCRNRQPSGLEVMVRLNQV